MEAEKTVSIQPLLDILEASGNNYQIDKIKKAFDYAALLHEGQRRESGEPYISHPLAVAEIVATLGLDSDSICAALLHDTVEDCGGKTDLKEIEKRFGADVALLVDGLQNILCALFINKYLRIETAPETVYYRTGNRM